VRWIVGKPLLDVADVLLDPDFCDSSLQCLRNSEIVVRGRSQITTTTIPFVGVVTSDRGDLLNRDAAAERIGGSISVITKFSLRAAGVDIAADIVVWGSRQYTVQTVNDYTTYGAGFKEALCDLKPLAGEADA
jgi:galactose-6-phosphate isomerase